MKFYRTDLTSKKHAGIQFSVVAIVAGTAVGVYSTDKPDEIEALKSIKLVSEITAEEHEDLVKKKAPSLKSYNGLSVPSKPPTTAIVGSGNVVVVAEPRPEKEIAPVIVGKVETTAEAIVVGDVGDAPKAPEEQKPTTRKGGSQK